METKITSNVEQQTDWKALATDLARELIAIVSHIKHDPRHSEGLWLTVGTPCLTQHWKDRAADVLEKFPGVKIDREVMHANDLPRKQREAFRAQRRREKEAKAA